eukprot:361988-Chlamydomonas_euryale.AAC.6
MDLSALSLPLRLSPPAWLWFSHLVAGLPSGCSHPACNSPVILRSLLLGCVAPEHRISGSLSVARAYAVRTGAEVSRRMLVVATDRAESGERIRCGDG